MMERIHCIAESIAFLKVGDRRDATAFIEEGLSGLSEACTSFGVTLGIPYALA